MLIDDLSKLPDSFKSGYRGIVLLHRNKDGNTGNAQRKSVKKISGSVTEWYAIIEQFRHMQQTSHIGYRIYASVNERNMHKAIHEFKRRQLEFDYSNSYELDEFYRNIDNRFFSCIMQPTCRSESYFLIDCDSDDEYKNAKRILKKELIVFEYPTKNGMHIITYPFNPNYYEGIDIKKDDLLSIG